ncbi:ABC transporter ATP-binding protein [Ruminococcaceae bacterium OttesenSCG-928-N02]|nr:ABC transporter ATP-binding protein [Ruminococcaceae bacterium OttesenSCG-928-N02]
MAPIIRVANLRKVYKIGKERVVALNNIDLVIEEGEVVSIVGPSGSGKSTLLNQLAGLEKPTRGEVFIGKNNITKMNENELATFRQKYLGFVFQSYNLLPALTAAENVALPLVFKGVAKDTREKEAKIELEKMGLGSRAGHKPTEMSGGQQQRVGIARAFIGTPKVVFADEPTGNLDSKTTQTVLEAMLASAKERGITFIMVTHDPGIAAVADRVVTIMDGQVLSDVYNKNPGYKPPEVTQYSAQAQNANETPAGQIPHSAGAQIKKHITEESKR